ncbi:MAG: xanthine dehydrogenase family protein subunit M [Sphingomonadaceae bacterium]|nr:xanthine dehydrogenase family protein subunit M [Sphingomonadaceae bacterium]
MREFEFARATSLEDAAAQFASGGEAALIAGGHTLLPAMKSRLRMPDRLIDINGIPGLDRIERDGDRLWIGATARHATVADDATVKAAIPSLAQLALLIGDPQVRNRGTLGGSIANNDPAADYPAACLALDATVETTGGSYAADDFFLGMFTTALADGEIVTRVGFRLPQAGAYAKFRHPASRYAMAAVYVARFADGWRVAVTGAAAAVFRWSEAEAALAAGRSVDGLVLEAADLNSDIHASADYRAHLCGVMLARAVADLG